MLDNGKLVELITDDSENESLVGNIYAGLVTNILPSQFAFVDIGLAKNAFVYLSDSREAGVYNEKGKLLIKNGQTVLVQVLKDASGSKGVYVTSNLSFTGRYLVITGVTDDGTPPVIGISKKIGCADERARLKDIAQSAAGNGMEVVVRTNAAGVSEDVIKDEFIKLNQLVEKSKTQWRNALARTLVYKETDSLRKAVMDLYTANVDEIVINDGEACGYIRGCIGEIPDGGEVRLYDGVIPIFDMYGIEKQIEQAKGNKRVWLKSGGFIVIERTEACVVIDVNTGKYAGAKNHEETVLKVNLEAAETIAEQLRLRNLSGIIIVDFIDMKDARSVKLLTDRLTEAVKKDRLAVNVVGMTELGLMQMTRKKTRKPL